MDVLTEGIVAAGAQVVSCSFPAQRVAPIYIGAEDQDGHRYGLLAYPFTTTKRATTNRPSTEHRFQIRYGDPKRVRNEPNPIGLDPAGVDVTMVLAVDTSRRIIVGLDPLLYSDLPMGISGYYSDANADAVVKDTWAVWVKEKKRTPTSASWEGLEAMVGFRPERLLDYARFEAVATGLGLETGLRARLAQEFAAQRVTRHQLERLFGVSAATILDIVDSNFRLGVAVRGSVAEHHLGALLAEHPRIARCEPIDQDGQPDFHLTLNDGRQFSIECKNALRETYKSGEAKVETQKTRDSGAGRKYAFGSFDIIAACMFSVTGRWTFQFKWARDLTPWAADPTRIGAIQRIDDTWSPSIDRLLDDCEAS